MNCPYIYIGYIWKMKKRRSIRLSEKDYSDPGEYFITIVTKYRKRFFGLPEQHSKEEGPLREIIQNTWLSIFDDGEYSVNHVLMPDHFHGIIALQNENCNEIDHADFKQRRRMRIPILLGKFKMLSSKAINDHYQSLGLGRPFKWQRNYYERVIRNERELRNVYAYIEANPDNWDEDVFKESNHF